MAHLYETKVTASGGRHGTIKSDDGLLSLSLAMPQSLGGPGGATNPEQLFAGGYAACFENALLRIAGGAGVKLADEDVDVIATVGLDRNAQNGFVLAVASPILISGLRPKNMGLCKSGPCGNMDMKNPFFW